MSDKPKHDEPATHPPRSDQPGNDQPGGQPPSGQPPISQPMNERDEAAPGTPGTGENIDPKTGERFTEGIGGA